MKLRNSLVGKIGITVAAGVLLIAVIFVFQIARNLPSGTNSAASSDEGPRGYPGLSTQDATKTTTDASPVETQTPSREVTTVTAAAATQFAQLTASVPTSPPIPGVVFGPQIISDSTGLVSLFLPDGWQAVVFGEMTVTNYDMSAYGSESDFPRNGLKIQIGVGRLSEGQTFDEWVSDRIAREISEDNAGPGVTASNPLPAQLGEASGVLFVITSPKLKTLEYVLSASPNLIVVSISPGDSPTVSEGQSLMSSLKINLPSSP